MSKKIVQLNEEVIKGQLKEHVRGSVEETLNGLLEAGTSWRYERSEQRQDYRSGHYNRNLMTTAGEVIESLMWITVCLIYQGIRNDLLSVVMEVYITQKEGILKEVK